MKKLIALILITMAVSAQAQHHHRHSGNWVAPVIVGGVIGYALTRNYYEPVYNYGYVPPPPVVVQQPVRSVCTPWTETQYADGTITRTRTCQ
jgi:hypothetical protein